MLYIMPVSTIATPFLEIGARDPASVLASFILHKYGKDAEMTFLSQRLRLVNRFSMDLGICMLRFLFWSIMLYGVQL